MPTLAEYKSSLPPVRSELIIAADLPLAHEQLGRLRQKSIIASLSEQTASMPEEEYEKQLQFLDSCRQFSLTRANEIKDLDPQLSEAIGEYFTCLDAWAKGAGISPQEAYFLQMGGCNCQTTLVRGQSGEVILTHSEEADDAYSPPATNTWTTFAFSNQLLTTYTAYTDLLPGPAFNRTPHGFLTFNTLFLNDLGTTGFLPNQAAWTLWRLGREEDLVPTISHLLPCTGGFAVNQVYAKDGKVIARSTEFGHHETFSRLLSPKPGSFLYQTNQTHPYSPLRSVEALPPDLVRKLGLLSITIQTALTLHNEIAVTPNEYVWATLTATVSPSAIAQHLETGPLTS